MFSRKAWRTDEEIGKREIKKLLDWTPDAGCLTGA
jgi:hypothetical protein